MHRYAVCFSSGDAVVIDHVHMARRAIPAPSRESSRGTCVQFTNDGSAVFVGWSRGSITLHDSATLVIVARADFAGHSPVTSISISHEGDTVLVNTADRVRLCSATSLRVEREFVDAVNRVPFRVSCFSGNGDYIAAGPSRKSAPHSIYIWNRLDGSLLALLDGPLRGIIAIQWHAHKPVIVAVMSTGEPVVWSKNVSENWQAFAPDFVELEENVVFDESQLDDMPAVAPDALDEAVDILTISAALDDTADGLRHLPISPLDVD